MIPHISLSVDLVILATFLAVVVVGFALGQERMRGFALSIYVGLALAIELGDPASKLLASHGTSLTAGRVRLTLFALPILILTLTHHPHGRGKRRGMIIPMVLSIVMAALIITSAIHLMDPEMSRQILGSSSLADPLNRLWLVWLVLVPVAAIAEIFGKSGKKH